VLFVDSNPMYFLRLGHTAEFGYFVLLSNEIKDPNQSLWIYRNKDVVEKACAL
jgi:hypothetical protein